MANKALKRLNKVMRERMAARSPPKPRKGQRVMQGDSDGARRRRVNAEFFGGLPSLEALEAEMERTGLY